MSEIRRAALFGRLNRLTYKAIDSATVFCKLRGNPYVELIHWLHQILQLADSDLHHIINHFRLDAGRLAKDLMASLDKLPRGATSISDLSSHVEDSVERGWVYATLMFNDSMVSSGHLLVGILKTRSLQHELFSISKEFEKVRVDELTDTFDEILSGSPEDRTAESGGLVAQQGDGDDSVASAQLGQQAALQRFSVDLTKKAREGEIDPVVGRDDEIRQIVDILMRRRQNNPILTGEAGVGKTAVVEGFALHIATGDVPPQLRKVVLRSLDLGALKAGASMKGEFESRLKQVIEEVQSSVTPIVLFIDEAHVLMGAGGAAGTGDAANLLKPALARGQLRTIAATTWAEYKEHIESDAALTRRFQVVQVKEPEEAAAIRMMRAVASTLEKHHGVQLLDEALVAAVRLSRRYIPARQLPDKSINLLDTAAARVAISLHAVPAEVSNCRSVLEFIETELEIIDNESAVGIDVGDRQEKASAELKAGQERLASLEARWTSEKELIQQIVPIRNQLRGISDSTNGDGSSDDESDVSDQDAAAETAKDAATDPSQDGLLTKLSSLQEELDRLQGETPLMFPCVDEQAVASVVADWTGIPIGKMVKNEIETVLKLPEILNKRVIGQSHALEMISKRIQTARATLDNPNKPIGVFMLCGPSGVGKTETALALADTLYGGEHNLITINMSEFQEAHTVSTLKGSPPGYVGYGKGGILTEAVRRRPHSVVLLDEIEKAHSDVHELFFQVFDKGVMEDSEGQVIDFKNTVILLTSNVGSDLIMNMCQDPDLMPSVDGLTKSLRKPLLGKFPAALLGRLVVIPYLPLSDEMIGLITRLQLDRIKSRVSENYGIPFNYDDGVVDLIVSRCNELESGGRMIDAILTNTLLPTTSREVLGRIMESKPMASIDLSVKDDDFEYIFG